MKLATHDGNMHADDLLAYGVLQRIFPAHELVRTRNVAELATADLAFDVGGECNPAKGRYDHHIRPCPARRNGVPYSSFGLVWEKFGARYLGLTLRRPPTDPSVLKLHRETAERLVMGVDSIDNGVPADNRGGVSLTAYARASAVARSLDAWNANWDERRSPAQELRVFQTNAKELEKELRKTVLAAVKPSPADPDERWDDFAARVGKRCLGRTEKKQRAVDRARITVERLTAKQRPSPLLVLPTALPWQEFLSAKTHPGLDFVLFPTPKGDWHIQGLPVEPGSFRVKTPLPLDWRGKPPADLAGICGVADAVFCHPTGFIGGAKSRESAIRMGQLALELTPGREI
jgi:uncharacterized UPF0160 family protein